MNDHEEKEIINQFGVHYFQDTFHYRNEDLKFWLPILKNLKTGWMVLKSDKGRAIPEDFINSLLKNGITPIIEFNLPIRSKIGTRDLKLLIQMYAKWGVKYVIFYDRPNQKESWTDNYWTQSDLIDRFLDLYIPLAKFAINDGLIPVFSTFRARRKLLGYSIFTKLPKKSDPQRTNTNLRKSGFVSIWVHIQS